MKHIGSVFIVLVLQVCCQKMNATTQPLFENNTGGYTCYRIPAIIKSPQGNLLAFAEGRRASCNDFGDVDILLRISYDGGANWSNPRVVAENGNLQAGNPAPVVDFFDPRYPEGRILLFYNLGNASENEIRHGKGKREVAYISSTDDGKSWTTPTIISNQVHFNANNTHSFKDWRTHANTPGHAIQLKRSRFKGRIYIPANHSTGDPQEGFNEYRAYGFYSDDHAKTWSVSPDINIPSSNEAIGVELPNGDLMLNIREQNGKSKKRLVALSSDGGTSWKELFFDAQLITPVCQSSILLIEFKNKNILVYSGPNSTSKREKMTLKFSMDSGRSWTKEKEIYSGGAAYSDLVQINADSMGIFYEKDFNQLVFEMYSFQELLQ